MLDSAFVALVDSLIRANAPDTLHSVTRDSIFISVVPQTAQDLLPQGILVSVAVFSLVVSIVATLAARRSAGAAVKSSETGERSARASEDSAAAARETSRVSREAFILEYVPKIDVFIERKENTRQIVVRGVNQQGKAIGMVILLAGETEIEIYPEGPDGQVWGGQKEFSRGLFNGTEFMFWQVSKGLLTAGMRRDTYVQLKGAVKTSKTVFASEESVRFRVGEGLEGTM